ncbi:MAG: hypothetical protein ABR518_08160, partial [Actinomycetota bacterium]
GGPFGPPAPVWIGVLVLLVLGLIGLPWAWSVLPRPGGPAVAVAPAFGLAATALIAIVVDATGLRLGSAGGWVAATLAFGGGLIAVAARRRRRSEQRPA